jgi:hypothetical protein
LITIAGQAGGRWPKRARNASLALSGSVEVAEESRGIRLLADCRTVFVVERMSTEQLLAALLTRPDSEWKDHYGKDLDSRVLANLLKPYKVQPQQVRIQADKTAKGYKREDFEKAWARWLPAVSPPGETTETS